MKFRSLILALLMLALAACGSITASTVARVDQATFTRTELDARIARIEAAQKEQPAQPGQQLPSKIEIEQQLVDQFISQNLMLGIAK